MTSTEKALNTLTTRIHSDMAEATGALAVAYPQLSPLKDRVLMSMWLQQLSLMSEALHEWSWLDIYDCVKKYGTISTTIFLKHYDADHDYTSCPDEVTDDAFDALWARINDATLQAGHPSDNVEISIQDIPEGESRLISHPNYPEFYLLVEVRTTVMYQSDDYFVHEFRIKHGGVAGEQGEIVQQ